ncbi:hypothetical protein I3760_01G122100 [Carya illinoinensis]|nr:hypothetical protein I3760_01G122100 [Carya illinoinensis]
MGVCFSSVWGRESRASHPTAKIISVNGVLHEYPVPVTVSQVLETEKSSSSPSSSSSSSSCFVCNSDRLYYDDYIPALDGAEELLANQIYFVFPASKLQQRLTASDMAALAVKASVALQNSSKNNGNRRKKARISPVVMVKQSVSFESTKIDYDGTEDRFGYGYGPRSQKKTPITDAKPGVSGLSRAREQEKQFAVGDLPQIIKQRLALFLYKIMDEDALSAHIKAIDEKLDGLTPIYAQNYCIFKVHDQLLEVNEKAYKPVLLAIGPYNDHRQVGQGLMEEHKLRYLSQMLRRRNESSVAAYIEALRKLEGSARSCYAERIPHNTYEFVEMMLLDGCFIIELFRKFETWYDASDDPIFQISWMLDVIARDLMLFENQLPYFVLTVLFEMSESSQALLLNRSGHLGEHTINIEENNEFTNREISTARYSSVQNRRLADLAISFFSSLLLFRDWDVNGSHPYSTGKPFQLCRTHKAITPPIAKMVHEHLEVGDKFKKADFKHLLDLIHTIIRLSILDMELHRATERQEVGVIFKNGERLKHSFGLIHRVVSDIFLAKMENTTIEDWDSIRPYGTELREAGVKFKMAKIFRDKT